MKIQCTVFDVQKESYTGRRGEVTQVMGLFQDNSDNGARLRNLIEMAIAPEVQAELVDSNEQVRRGEKVELDITEALSVFGGRLRVKGSLTIGGQDS